MENKTLQQRGFKLTTMTQREFNDFVRKHDATRKRHLIGLIYTSGTTGEEVAVVTFDNGAIRPRIWVKEGLS